MFEQSQQQQQSQSQNNPDLVNNSNDQFSGIQPKILFKVCCCCIPIQPAVQLIGILDVIGLIGAILTTILNLIGGTVRGFSFYSGTYLFTIVPGFILVRLIRSALYFRMRLDCQEVAKRDQYFKGRLVTFGIMLVISIVDLLIYCLDMSKAIIIRETKRSEDSKEEVTTGTITFYGIFGFALIAAYAVVDMYFCMIIRQYRDDLIIEYRRSSTRTQPLNQVEINPVVAGTPVYEDPILDYDQMYGFKVVEIKKQQINNDIEMQQLSDNDVDAEPVSLHVGQPIDHEF
eukprot:403346460